MSNLSSCFLSPDEYRGHSLLEACRQADNAKVKKLIAVDIVNFKHPHSQESPLVDEKKCPLTFLQYHNVILTNGDVCRALLLPTDVCLLHLVIFVEVLLPTDVSLLLLVMIVESYSKETGIR